MSGEREGERGGEKKGKILNSCNDLGVRKQGICGFMNDSRYVPCWCP